MVHFRLVLPLAASLAVVPCLAGCALTTDTIDVQYRSTTPAGPVAGAERVTVQVRAVEGRTGRPDRVGVKKNGYGMEMAAILSSRPVPDIVQQAIVEELRKQGFQIGAGGAAVAAEVNRFTNDFKPGFFSGDAVADITLAVQVLGPAGQILYTRTLTGQGTNGGVVVMGGENARVSLEAALSDAVTRLMSDQAFIRALLDAGRRRGARV